MALLRYGFLPEMKADMPLFSLSLCFLFTLVLGHWGNQSGLGNTTSEMRPVLPVFVEHLGPLAACRPFAYLRCELCVFVCVCGEPQSSLESSITTNPGLIDSQWPIGLKVLALRERQWTKEKRPDKHLHVLVYVNVNLSFFTFVMEVKPTSLSFA